MMLTQANLWLKLYKCWFVACWPWFWFTNIPLSLFSIFCGSIHMSFHSKLSMDGYSQAVWHQSDLSWQLCRYKKKCEGRSTSAGMTQFDLHKSQNEIQEHHNPTNAVYSFTTNFNFKEVRVQKNRGNTSSPRRNQPSWCCMILLYDTVRGPQLEHSLRIEAIFSSWTITELLAFWKLHCCLWKCSWLRWSLFYIYINYLDNNWFF